MKPNRHVDSVRDCHGCTVLDSPTVNNIFSLETVEELEADQLTGYKGQRSKKLLTKAVDSLVGFE